MLVIKVAQPKGFRKTTREVMRNACPFAHNPFDIKSTN